VANTLTSAATYTVAWGDGQTGSYKLADVPIHTYASAGTYTITDTVNLTIGSATSTTTTTARGGLRLVELEQRRLGAHAVN